MNFPTFHFGPLYQHYDTLFVWGNSYAEYLQAWVLFLGLFVVFRVFRTVIITQVRVWCNRTPYSWDERIITAIHNSSPWFWRFLSLYLAVHTLTVSLTLQQVLDAILIILSVVEATRIAQAIIELTLFDAQNKSNQSAIRGVKTCSKIVLWIIAFLMILSNLGINVTALATSLGIGGIAIALALQSVLADLFASFTIYFDKPFQVGDYIEITEEHSGTVKDIGLKTTRIETLYGEELVISNKELTEARIHNYGRMQKRRVSFSLKIEYSTNTKQLADIPGIIRAVIEAQDHTKYDQGNLASFEDWYIKFDFIYYIDNSDWSLYIDTQERVLRETKEALEKQNIDIAFPSQSIYLNKDS